MNSPIPEIYCRDKTAPDGSGLYYSTLYYPGNTRRDLYALHALHHEIGLITAECSDPGVARMKLAWWLEEIQRLFAGTARHPVSKELNRVVARHDINLSGLIGLVRHYETRINPVWPDSWEAFPDFLEPGPGLVWRYSASVCGYTDPDTPDIICRLGCLFELFSLLQGRPIIALPLTEQIHVYLPQIIREIHQYCEKIPLADHKTQQGALIFAGILLQTAEEIVRAGYPSTSTIALTPLRKFWIAWQTHRKMMKVK